MNHSLNVTNMIKKIFGGLIFIVLFILIFSIQVQAQAPVPACKVSLTIRHAAIDPGDDNEFKVCLNGVNCGKIPVRFLVTDPLGVEHEYLEITPSAAPWCTSWVSYLTKFDNIPNTDESGRYYVVARVPDQVTGEEWDQNDFVVRVISCDEAYNNGVLMAERQITIESIPEMVPSDMVECCHLDCCLDLILDADCSHAGGTFPPPELRVGTTEPSSFGYAGICHTVLSNFDLEYASINASKYVVIGNAVEDSDTHYWIVDVGEGGCILGDITKCELTTKRLLIDEGIYRDYVVTKLAHADPVCGGFYTPEIPFPYHRVQNTSRYLAIYKELTDFLYCRMAPELIKNSKWCHLVNFDWYSVVNLSSERNVTYITPEAIEAENEWNNLSGYIVLGHACPLMRNVSDTNTYFGVAPPPDPACFDAVDPPEFNIPCNNPFEVPCGSALTPCIYVWKSIINGTIGYNKSFCYSGLATSGIELLVADNRTDTQIPAINITRGEIRSIKSNVTIDLQTSACNPIGPISETFNYTNGTPAGDYRSCSEDDVSYYRLFDKNTTWVKVFTVTPMLEDRRDLGGGEGWYWNWSRTSPPENDVNVTIYIGGGCKRISAFYFDYPLPVVSTHSYYTTPIIDYVNVTIYDGQNPPVTYNVSGWNLLPFPPADSIVNATSGDVIDHHPYEGIRYSYFAINHTVPENAAYLYIEANYTCETTLERNATIPPACGGMDMIHDKSTVYDNFTIEFLDHENPKDNCKWTNPMAWRNISGYWNRTWDATLGKHVLHLNTSNILNRIMVSIDNISNNTIIEVLVKGATPLDPADATIGFYSNEDASRYWFLNLHEEFSTGGTLSIGYRRDVAPTRAITNSVATTFTNGPWYWVKILLREGNISAKYWQRGSPEPVGWQIAYLIPGTPIEKIFGNHWVIGTEHGFNDEEFWFDPDPMCGINITGYYDSEFLAPFGYSVVTGGYIEIEIEPDILSGFTISVGETPRVEYGHVAHPAKHILYRKEKAVPSPPYPDRWEFYYDDKYEYESRRFGFNELCKLPLCPSNCYCTPGDIFTPECINVQDQWGWKYYPDDCICLYNECYPDPCDSSRTYHEYEGIYYDFVDFHNYFLPENVTPFHIVENTESSSWISIEDMSYGVNLAKANSPRGRYRFYFSCVNVNLTAGSPNFEDDGKITLYTHFRNYTYKLSDNLTSRGHTTISYSVNPLPEDIEPGDLVTVTLTLSCGAFPLGNEDVEIIVTNYQKELIGVSWSGDKAYVTTNGAGIASFSFVMRQDSAKVTLYYEGGRDCGEEEVNFILGGEEVKSIITSVEFFLLIILFILAIFSYRFFKKGRLDFYEMWQEFRGEKD